MREKFSTGSVPFGKAYLKPLIDVVEVDDTKIRVKGSRFNRRSTIGKIVSMAGLAAVEMQTLIRENISSVLQSREFDPNTL